MVGQRVFTNSFDLNIIYNSVSYSGKSENIQNEATVELNDETSPLYENKLNNSKYDLKIEKNLVVVHSDTTID